MPDERWEAAQQIFHAAVGKPPLQRERILVEACGQDTLMRDQLRSMLAMAEEPHPRRRLSFAAGTF